jgi:Holliday junction resolvase
MSGKAPKRKGSGYEREVANYMKEKINIDASRTPMSGAINNLRADLMGTPHIHVECKRTEKFQIYAALKQAEVAKKDEELVAVMNRRNQMKTGESLVVMRLDDWLLLYESYLKERGEK